MHLQDGIDRISRVIGIFIGRIEKEHDPIAESWSAVCPKLPRCASAGDTEAEARDNIHEAIRLYLAPSDIDLPHDAKLIEVMVG